MQQIADWLEKLGLSEYAQRFAENGIDVSVLRAGASGPGHRALQSGGASAVGGAIWPGCRVVIWLYRAIASWLLGYPDAALADTNQALADTRAIGQAGTLMFALLHASLIDMLCRDYAATSAATDELAVLAEQKGALFWKALGLSMQGCMCAMTGKAADAVTMITSGIAASRSTGATLWVPVCLAYLTAAHAELGQFDDAWRCIGEALSAVETTKESWYEAEVNRISGEIALLSPRRNTAKAQAYFERALAVARAAGKVLGTARGHEHGAA